jgi:hypothetical protein
MNVTHPFQDVVFASEQILHVGAHRGRDGGIVILAPDIGFASVKGRELRNRGYGFSI